MEKMGAQEFHTWMAFYQIEKEEWDAEVAKGKAELEVKNR